MKKTYLALIVAIFLGGFWGIASWLTGKHIETHFAQHLDNLNTQLNQFFPNEEIQLSYQHYQRGVFRTHVQLNLETKENIKFLSGNHLIFNETIDHGPFPLSQMKTLSFLPALASIHTELEKTDNVAKLFEIAENHSIFYADTRINYQGANKTKIRLNPINYNHPENNERYRWENGMINIDHDPKNSTLKINSHINNVSLETMAEGQPVIFTLDTLNLNSSKEPSAAGIPISHQIIEIKKLGANVNGHNALMLEDLTGKTLFHVEGDTASLDMNYQLHNVKLEKLDLGSGQIAINISKLSASTLKKMIDDYRLHWEESIKNPLMQKESREYQQKMREFFINHIPELLKSSPEIKIQPLSWENQAGKSISSLNILFQDPSLHHDSHQNSIVPIKSLSSQIKINKNMLTEVLKQIAIINGEDASLANQYAMLRVKSMATLAAISGLITQKEDDMIIDLKFNNDILFINGRKISLEQLLSGYIPPSIFSSEKDEEE